MMASANSPIPSRRNRGRVCRAQFCDSRQHREHVVRAVAVPSICSFVAWGGGLGCSQSAAQSPIFGIERSVWMTKGTEWAG